jgi:hypothetical protein
MSRLTAGFITSAPEHCYAPLAWTGPAMSTDPYYLGFPLLICSRIKEKLRNGEISVSGDHWPVFLYHGYNYDPEDPWNGLLRSALLVSVSPDSACFQLKRIITFLGLQTYIYIPELRRQRTQSHSIGQCSYPRDDTCYATFYRLRCYPSSMIRRLRVLFSN